MLISLKYYFIFFYKLSEPAKYCLRNPNPLLSSMCLRSNGGVSDREVLPCIVTRPQMCFASFWFLYSWKGYTQYSLSWERLVIGLWGDSFILCRLFMWILVAVWSSLVPRAQDLSTLLLKSICSAITSPGAVATLTHVCGEHRHTITLGLFV